MKPYLSSLTILSLALMSLVTYSFTTAQWVNPPAGPPNRNVSAPINVGNLAQTKSGDMGARIVFANDSMASDLYCDRSGLNCAPPLPPLTDDTDGYILTRNGDELYWNEPFWDTLGLTLYHCPDIQPGSWGHNGCHSSCVGQITTMNTCRYLNQSGGNCTHSGPHQIVACTLLVSGSTGPS